MINNRFKMCLFLTSNLIFLNTQEVFSSNIIDEKEINYETIKKSEDAHGSSKFGDYLSIDSFTHHFQKLPNESFTFQGNLGGGTESAFQICDSFGKKWVLKYWSRHEAGVSESLARYLMDVLSDNNSLENNYFISNNLPECISRCLPPPLQEKLKSGELYSLTPFIEGKLADTQIFKAGNMQQNIAQHFVMSCFLSYFDAKDNNTMIENISKKIHFIDTGSSILYRSMGGKKEINEEWHPYYLSEFSSMLRHTNIFTNNEIENLENIKNLDGQVNFILERGHSILEVADAFLRHIGSKERIEILSMLSNRLYQLEIFYNIKTGKWSPKARKYAQTSNIDGAGALIFSEYGGKKYLLLGKRATRNGSGTWCNLGGAADPGEFFHESAAREVFEESGNMINIGKKIVEFPSHDLVSEHKPGIFKRYRSYLVENEYFDPSIIIGKNKFTREYSEYKWVEVQDLLNILNKKDERMLIFPPFAQSLQQKTIYNWLTSLLEGKNIAQTHTQDFVAPDHQRLLKKKDTFYHFNNPAEHIKECAHEFIKSTARRVPKNEHSKENGESISLLFLKKLAEEKSYSLENIDELFEKVYRERDFSEKLGLISHAVEQCIEEEKKHPNHYVMYHGMRSDIWLMYRALSYIRSKLDASSHLQTTVLRSMEKIFDDIKSAKDLQEKIHNAEIKNDSTNVGHATVLSCNPTLFSNYPIIGEETIGFFINNTNIAPLDKDATKNILIVLLQQLGIEQSDEIFKKLGAIDIKNSGVLLQFFIPKEDHRYFYVSRAWGKPIYYNDRQMVTDTEEAMKKIAAYNDHDFYNDPSIVQTRLINRIQTRLHLNIAHNENVIVNDYLANPELNINEIDTQIAEALDPYLETLAENAITDTAAYRTPILVQNIAREILDLNKNDMKKEVSPLNYAIKNHNTLELKKIISNDPTLQKGLDITLKSINEKISLTLNEDQIRTFLTIDNDYAKKITNVKVIEYLVDIDEKYRNIAIFLFEKKDLDSFYMKNIIKKLKTIPTEYFDGYAKMIEMTCKNIKKLENILETIEAITELPKEHINIYAESTGELFKNVTNPACNIYIILSLKKLPNKDLKGRINKAIEKTKSEKNAFKIADEI